MLLFRTSRLRKTYAQWLMEADATALTKAQRKQCLEHEVWAVQHKEKFKQMKRMLGKVVRLKRDMGMINGRSYKKGTAFLVTYIFNGYLHAVLPCSERPGKDDIRGTFPIHLKVEWVDRCNLQHELD